MSFIFITTIYWVPGMCQTLVKVINVSCYNSHLPNLSGFTQHRLFLTQVKLSVGRLWGRDWEQGLCSTQSQGPTLFPRSHLGPWNYSLSPLHPARNPGGAAFPSLSQVVCIPALSGTQLHQPGRGLERVTCQHTWDEGDGQTPVSKASLPQKLTVCDSVGVC